MVFWPTCDRICGCHEVGDGEEERAGDNVEAYVSTEMWGIALFESQAPGTIPLSIIQRPSSNIIAHHPSSCHI
jgi:hypothetical protein